MSVLVLIAALASTEPLENCMIADTHRYTSADTERFPAVGSGEIDWATAVRISKAGGTYFEIDVDRCSKRPTGLMKYQAGKAVYGYYYRYKHGRLVELDLRYIDGSPTAQEILDHI